MKIPIKKIRTADESHFDERGSDPDDAKFHRHITPLKIISTIFFLIYFFCAAFVCIIFTTLSVLPLKYLTILIAASAFFAIIFAFLTFKKFKKSQKISRFLKILTIIFEIVFTAAFVLIFFYLNHTMNFMDSIRASEYQIENYSVLVKKDSKFGNIEDLHYGTITTYDDGSESYTKALDELAEKIKYKQIEEENLSAAVKAIVNDETDSLLIKTSLIELATEVFDGFKSEDYRTLYTISIKTAIKNLEVSKIDVTRDSFNIYISGIDTYGDIATVARSDVNMIVTINPKTHKILLTSIPRDYYVQLHGTTGLKDKLTHSGLYGIDMTIDTIEDLLGINIDYYIRVNFDSTIGLIDALGGVDVIPDITFSRPSNGRWCSYYEGVPNHLDGTCALRYARERKAYGAGDMHRIQNQQEVLTAIIDKLTSSKTLLTEYTKILSSLSGSLETNIPSGQIYALINEQLNSMPSWTIERISLNGTHIDAPTYTISTEYLYVFEPIPESIAEVTAKIQAVMTEN